MGISSFWSWLLKKGYRAAWRRQISPSGRTLVDVGSIMYTMLQNRTLWSTSGSAFAAIDQTLLRMFHSRDNIELVFDGESPAEKDPTTLKRKESRNQQRVKASELLDKLEMTVNTTGCWAGKGKTRSFRMALQRAWYLSVSGREALSEYLKDQGWHSRVADFEADVELPQMCQPMDVVVTKDSDLAAYLSVNTIARPARQGFLIYDIDKACSVLGLPSRIQLQALAIVSGNDYGRNIYGLGLATNAAIIKALPSNTSGMLLIFMLHSANSWSYLLLSVLTYSTSK